jgi:hypothetical protein
MHISALTADDLFKTLGHAGNLRPVMGNNILGMGQIISE